MLVEQDRLNRERETIQIMIEVYCHGNHQTKGTLCSECQDLSDYAMQRIDKCPFQEEKPTCAKCPIHCYKADKREQIRNVMRYAGPRMMLYHPILTIRHYIDEYTKTRVYKKNPRGSN